MPNHKWAYTLLMLTLAVWGGYVAAGASRFNWDMRKGWIVAGCVLAFLGLWIAMLLIRTRRKAVGGDTVRSDSKEIAPLPRTWSAPCLGSLMFALLAGVTVGIYESGLIPPTTGVAQAAASVTAASILGAVILGMIGLSDPTPRRGKWLAGVALVAIGGLVVGWMWVRSGPSV